MTVVLYMLNETTQRSICEPEFFPTFEQAQEEMLNRIRETLDAPGDADKQTLEALIQGHDGELMEDEAYCTSRNHDDCDWKIHEVCLPLTVDGKLIS